MADQNLKTVRVGGGELKVGTCGNSNRAGYKMVVVPDGTTYVIDPRYVEQKELEKRGIDKAEWAKVAYQTHKNSWNV